MQSVSDNKTDVNWLGLFINICIKIKFAVKMSSAVSVQLCPAKSLLRKTAWYCFQPVFVSLNGLVS